MSAKVCFYDFSVGFEGPQAKFALQMKLPSLNLAKTALTSEMVLILGGLSSEIVLYIFIVRKYNILLDSWSKIIFKFNSGDHMHNLIFTMYFTFYFFSF